MEAQSHRYLRILVALFAVLVLLNAVFGFLLLRKVERITVVTENLNHKVNDVVAASAPVGHAAVKQGVQMLENVDTKDLAESATKGLKQFGSSVTNAAADWAKRKAQGQANQDASQGTATSP